MFALQNPDLLPSGCPHTRVGRSEDRDCGGADSRREMGNAGIVADEQRTTLQHGGKDAERKCIQAQHVQAIDARLDRVACFFVCVPGQEDDLRIWLDGQMADEGRVSIGGPVLRR